MVGAAAGGSRFLPCCPLCLSNSPGVARNRHNLLRGEGLCARVPCRPVSLSRDLIAKALASKVKPVHCAKVFESPSGGGRGGGKREGAGSALWTDICSLRCPAVLPLYGTRYYYSTPKNFRGVNVQNAPGILIRYATEGVVDWRQIESKSKEDPRQGDPTTRKVDHKASLFYFIFSIFQSMRNMINTINTKQNKTFEHFFVASFTAVI